MQESCKCPRPKIFKRNWRHGRKCRDDVFHNTVATPGELRKYYREQVQDIVYGAMVR
jgi:hypothetical protein